VTPHSADSMFRLQLIKELGRGSQLEAMQLTRNEADQNRTYDGGLASIIDEHNNPVFQGPTRIIIPKKDSKQYPAFTCIDKDLYVAYLCNILYEPPLEDDY
jgi:hypothetical protein